MSEDRVPPVDDLRLSEDDAHRLLARAVELDAATASTLSIAQLREVARDAGIAPAAFDAAVRELQAPPRLVERLVERLGRRVRLRLDLDLGRGLTGAIGRNAIAIACGVGLISVASGASRLFVADWPGHQGSVIVGNVLAVLLARRLGARAVGVLWAVSAAVQLGEYPVHLALGTDVVQGGPALFALMLASLLGIGFGALLLGRGRAHRGDGDDAAPPPPPTDATPEADAISPPAPTPARPPLGSLRLRTA